MATSKPWVRWTVLGAGGLCVLLLVLGALVYAWSNSAPGRRWIAEQTGRALSTPGELVVTIDGVAGRLPGDILIDSVIVSDAEGRWLAAEGLRLSWDPWSLFGETLDVSLWLAERIAIERVPEAGEAVD